MSNVKTIKIRKKYTRKGPEIIVPTTDESYEYTYNDVERFSRYTFRSPLENAMVTSTTTIENDEKLEQTNARALCHDVQRAI